MFTAVALEEPQEVRELPMLNLLDEAEWQAWVAEQPAARLGWSAVIKAVKWASIIALLVLGGLWSRVTTFEVVARFAVAAGAIVVMAQSLMARRYAGVAVAAAIALLYNPLAPLFDLTGGWQRAVYVAGAAPFLAALIWRDMRTYREA